MKFYTQNLSFSILFFLIIISTAVVTLMYISYSKVDLVSEGTSIESLSLGKENWESLTVSEMEQSRRLATLKAYCENTTSMHHSSNLHASYGDLPTYQLEVGDLMSSSEVYPSEAHLDRHLLFFENIKTVYCFIPKTGCKTMKRLLSTIERLSLSKAEQLAEEDTFLHEHPNIEIKGKLYRNLKHYNKEEASLRLATYKKIIVVRDPLERLASAWLDKFVNMPKREDYFRWVEVLNRRLREYQHLHLPKKSVEVKEETFNATKPVPFREFLFAVSKNLLENEHWLSFSRLCLPCQVKYNFIFHTDSIASDVRLFLKKNNIAVNEDVLPEQRPRNVNVDNVFSEIYRQVKKEELLPLQEIFQEDFDMFGYSFKQDLEAIVEGKEKG